MKVSEATPVADLLDAIDRYRRALISTGCHDLLCEEAQRRCVNCPVHDPRLLEARDGR